MTQFISIPLDSSLRAIDSLQSGSISPFALESAQKSVLF